MASDTVFRVSLDYETVRLIKAYSAITGRTVREAVKDVFEEAAIADGRIDVESHKKTRMRT